MPWGRAFLFASSFGMAKMASQNAESCRYLGRVGENDRLQFPFILCAAGWTSNPHEAGRRIAVGVHGLRVE